MQYFPCVPGKGDNCSSARFKRSEVTGKWLVVLLAVPWRDVRHQCKNHSLNTPDRTTQPPIESKCSGSTCHYLNINKRPMTRKCHRRKCWEGVFKNPTFHRSGFPPVMLKKHTRIVYVLFLLFLTYCYMFVSIILLIACLAALTNVMQIVIIKKSGRVSLWNTYVFKRVSFYIA